MSALFDDTEEKRPNVDWWTEYATKKLGAPEGWRWFKIEALNFRAPREAQSTLITGAVVPPITRGKRKGQPNWRARDASKDTSMAISVPDMDAFRLEWEVANDKCHECLGTGETLASWSASSGETYRKCSRCKGTGKPVEATP